MVCKARFIDERIVLDKDEANVAINVSDETRMKSGSIPSNIRILDMRHSAPLFEKDSIPEELEIIHLKDIKKDSYYPPNLTIILRSYSGQVPLPDNKVFIHIWDINLVKCRDSFHVYRYDFGRSITINSDIYQSNKYECGKPNTMKICDEEITYVNVIKIV